MINPIPNQTIRLDGVNYRFTSVPNNFKIVYCESGRKSSVYRIKSGENFFALKVFFPKFRNSRIVEVNNVLRTIVGIQGVDTQNRAVFTKNSHPDLISEYPDLEYATLTPWIKDDPWVNYFTVQRQEVVLSKSLQIANHLCNLIYELENRSLAHSDLSGSNFLVGIKELTVNLVGLENMYGDQFPEPMFLPTGTPGYAHPNSSQSSQWCKAGDRFSAAILFFEILGMSNQVFTETAYGESFFSQSDLGKECERFDFAMKELKKVHPSLSELFSTSWFSINLDQCPSIKTWKDVFDKTV